MHQSKKVLLLTLKKEPPNLNVTTRKDLATLFINVLKCVFLKSMVFYLTDLCCKELINEHSRKYTKGGRKIAHIMITAICGFIKN